MANFSHRPDPAAATPSPWDYADAYDGPWYVFREPRDEHRLAIKSGHYTILTVSDYFDGGGPIEERLEWLCEIVNRRLRTKPRLGEGDPRNYEISVVVGPCELTEAEAVTEAILSAAAPFGVGAVAATSVYVEEDE